MRRAHLVLGATVLVLAGSAAGTWRMLHRPAVPIDIARGKNLYAEACAACHGANLEGAANWREPGPDGRYPAPPHDETGHTWHHSDRLLFDITSQGTAAVVGDGYESDMPGFGDDYSDAEIRDILAFIKSTWPEEQRTVQAEITARDEAAR